MCAHVHGMVSVCERVRTVARCVLIGGDFEYNRQVKRHSLSLWLAGPDPAGPAAAFSAYQPQQAAPDTPPDPPDMPGINRAGLLNLRNKLRLNRPALISPPTNTQSAPLSQPYPHDLSHGLPHDLPNRYDASVSQQTLSGPYQAVPPPSSNAASPVKTAAAAARLARRRAVAQEVGNPGADATMSPGDVRRGKSAGLQAHSPRCGSPVHAQGDASVLQPGVAWRVTHCTCLMTPRIG